MDLKHDPELVMKILQYGTDYTDRNFDRVRRDGLILERLTKSNEEDDVLPILKISAEIDE